MAIFFKYLDSLTCAVWVFFKLEKKCELFSGVWVGLKGEMGGWLTLAKSLHYIS
jgi:hypothetical protein